MADVTDEVWECFDNGKECVAGGHILRIKLQVPPPPEGMDYRDDDVTLFSGLGGDRYRTGTGAARARMASMAPNLFRTLSLVLTSSGVTLPPELEDLIRIRLHMASPDTHGMPDLRKDSPRRSGWERLLDEDA